MYRKIFIVLGLALIASLMVSAAEGSLKDKPMGFRFMEGRLTVKPSVSLSYMYDSNLYTTKHGQEHDSIFCVDPTADFTWLGERWALAGNVFYRYRTYCEHQKQLGENSYGEGLTYTWSNVSEEGRGWNLQLAEKYQFINQADSFSRTGRGVWRDRENFTANGALERRMNEKWHASVMGQYYWLDYDNDTGDYAPLYGWSERAVGLEGGYVLSKWTDMLISAGYSDYTQKKSSGYSNYSNDSKSWTVQGGVGTHATEKITYRALMGASWLEYGGHSGTDCGWTYQLSANWRIMRQLQWSLMGNSYYQPSERSLGQATKVYSLSTGWSYLTLGDRVTLTADVSWRLENQVYNDRYLTANNDYDEDILSFRLGANYTMNRWMSLYANFTYEKEWCDNSDYEYDRFQGTLGVRFHY